MYRIGILGCSEIAYRRFLPAIQNVSEIEAVAVAEEYAPEKARAFSHTYNIDIEKSFEDILNRKDIDCVYIPQPPALHFKWAKRALLADKHVLVEKPSTTSLNDTKSLVRLAKDKGKALHENYMFQYHSQIQKIKELLSCGKIGQVRLIRTDFGFPLRSQNDFRYNKSLGGGALLDAGGYTLKLASILLGKTVKVETAYLQNDSRFEVDIAGSATLSNENGIVCQASWGMDNAYRCSLEIWGSEGSISTGRIFTAPPDIKPIAIITKDNDTEKIVLETDAHFEHSIEMFCKEIEDDTSREQMYEQILLQARVLHDVSNGNF